MKQQSGYLTKKSGAWLGHYSRWVSDPATGTRKRQQRAFRIGPTSQVTKSQAQNKLRQRVVADHGVTADGKATVGSFITSRWLPLHEGTWRPSTRAVNKEHLKYILDRFGKTPVEDMDAVDMQSWLNTLAAKYSGSLVMHSRHFLRSIIGEAFEQEYIRKDTSRLLRVPKLKAVKREFLTVEDATALLTAAQWYPRDHTLLTVILVTGFRPSELFALKWKHLDMKAGTVTLTETVYRGKVRPYTKTTEEGETDHVTVYVPDAAMMALCKWSIDSKHNGDDDYIFPAPMGGIFTKENYQRRVLNPIVDMAGLEHVNFQILRRTVATHAQHLGSPKDIQEILRHKRVETAQKHYVQAISETVKATATALAGKMLKP